MSAAASAGALDDRAGTRSARNRFTGLVVALRRGDVLGTVGSTGNASDDAPHLHFAIFRLGPERRWWEGEAINPYPHLREGTVPR